MQSGIKIYSPATLGRFIHQDDNLCICLEKPASEIIIKPTHHVGIEIADWKSHPSNDITTLQNKLMKVGLNFIKEFSLDQKGFSIEVKHNIPCKVDMGSAAAICVGVLVGLNAICKIGLNARELIPYAMVGFSPEESQHAKHVATCLLGGTMWMKDTSIPDIMRLPAPKGIYLSKTIFKHNLFEELLRLDNPQLNPHTAYMGGLIGAFFMGDIEGMETLMRKLSTTNINEHEEINTLVEKIKDTGVMSVNIDNYTESISIVSKNSLDLDVANKLISDFFNSKKIDFTTYTSKINMEGVQLL